MREEGSLGIKRLKYERMKRKLSKSRSRSPNKKNRKTWFEEDFGKDNPEDQMCDNLVRTTKANDNKEFEGLGNCEDNSDGGDEKLEKSRNKLAEIELLW
jgi:hypothetical protein